MKTIVIALVFLSALCLAVPSQAEEHFSVRQYNHFHDMLHPLQHDALPGKDFARIRSDSREFARRGDAIVRLGVPRAVPKSKASEFRKELANFRKALAAFRKDSKTGTDAQLESSFSALHDSFEMLAGLLPRT